jgi:hypothetical protein
MMMKMFLAILAATCWCGVLPAHAGRLVANGDTTGNPTWNRPYLAGPALTETAMTVPYEVTPFFVSASAIYVLGTNADFDTYLQLYDENGFDPLDQLCGLIAGDDDSGGGRLSKIIFGLTAGTQYYAVVSGFADDSFGPYTLTISGSGDITRGNIVSEPAAVVLIIPALAGFGFSRRRKLH